MQKLYICLNDWARTPILDGAGRLISSLVKFKFSDRLQPTRSVVTNRESVGMKLWVSTTITGGNNGAFAASVQQLHRLYVAEVLHLLVSVYV